MNSPTSVRQLCLWTALISLGAMIHLSCSTSEHIVPSRLHSLELIMNGIDKRFQPAAHGLLQRGAEASFVYDVLHHPNTVFLEKMLTINVSGFIRPVDYSFNYNATSVRTARDFYRTRAEALKRAQESSGVPASVVCSILYVETKFGTVVGNHNVVSVYASLAAADLEENVELNRQSYRSSVRSSDSLAHLDSLVAARARRKAAWAVDQLMALKDIRERLPVPINELRGSWAGAFGWSQFIPSSYRSWSVDGNGDGVIDLFNEDDAIASVAHYLAVNGWGSTPQQQRAAIYHYNNSNAYVDCILTLASKIEESP